MHVPVITTVKPGKSLVAGQEIFTTYTEDYENWFADRGLVFQDKNNQSVYKSNVVGKLYDLSTLERVGHCLTDIAVNDSIKLPLAGKGIFAQRDFVVGDIVSISPVLLLPRVILEEEGNDLRNVLFNYCFGSSESNVLVLPFGLAGLMNHKPVGEQANVRVEWYTWSHTDVDTNTDTDTEANSKADTDTDVDLEHGDIKGKVKGNNKGNNEAKMNGESNEKKKQGVEGVEETETQKEEDNTPSNNHKQKKSNILTHESPIEELVHSKSAPLNFAYRATRDIKTGEELFLDYGKEWEDAWYDHLAGK